MSAVYDAAVSITADSEMHVLLKLETPSTPESGRYGPPEFYDPGSGPEWQVVGFRLFDVDLAASGIDGLVDALLPDDEPHRGARLELRAKLETVCYEAMGEADEPEYEPQFED